MILFAPCTHLFTTRNCGASIVYLTLGICAIVGCKRQSARPNSAVSRPTVNAKSRKVQSDVQHEPFQTTTSTTCETLFESLAPLSLGIDFVHRWDPPSELFMQIHSYASTVGVAIGDYDADGRPDVFLANQTDGGKLYRNLGNWKFEDVTASANVGTKGMWGTGVSFADINNDGRLDLAVCGFNCPNRVFINQGNGTFLERAKQLGLGYVGASTMLSFCDYDLDGDLDAYLLTNRMPPKKLLSGEATKVDGRVVVPDHLLEDKGVMNFADGKFQFMDAGQFDYMLRNDGDSFADVTKAAGMDKRNHHGLSATWWDPNNDGWPDLFVSNDFMWPDHLYIHNGNRSQPVFTDQVTSAMPHVPWFSMGSDIGDFDNDGRLDLIATDMSPTTHYRSKLTMGDMSTFAWFLEQAEPKQYMRNVMLQNTGTTRFREVAQMAGVSNSDWTWSVRAEDFDCDGKIDLFMTTGMTRDFENADYTEELNQLQSSARNNNQRAAIATRFWRDKPQLREANVAFRNEGDLSFQRAETQWGLDEKTVGFGCATGDLDGDGDLDIVVNNFSSAPSVYRNLSAEQQRGGNHRIKISLRGRRSNSFGIGARIDLHAGDSRQTRFLTIARGYMSSSEPSAYFGLGKHKAIDKLTIHWPSGVVQELESLSANHRYSIAEPTESTTASSSPPTMPLFEESDITRGIRHHELPFDDFSRQPLLPNRLSQLGPGIAWGDINGDGVDDLYVGGAHGEPGRPHLLKDGSFLIYTKRLQAFVSDAQCEDMGSLFFDADGDGDLDLYVVSGGIECEPGSRLLRDRLYLNDGGGRFDKASDEVLPDRRASGSCVVGADFDRDGDVDLFVGGRTIPGEYPVSPASSLLVNQASDGNAKFVEAAPPELADTGMVTAAIWSDVDNDQWIDLLIAHEWGPVKLFRNHEGTLVDATEDAQLANRLGWFNGIAGGDVDHDGDIDYVVTNFGQNTKYHASVAAPVEIYYGDFDGSRRKNIVEAVAKDDRILPVRGKSCSQNAMPFLRSKFPTYHEFAIEDLVGLYSQPNLDNALRLQINELDSGILLNDGSGHFQWQPLPRITQVSPGFGVTMTDLNLDGHVDILVGQNFFGPQRETGRMHGGMGQLLLGNGAGVFQPAAPSESGIVLDGDTKALTIAHLNADRRPDIIVSTNDGPVRALINQAETSRRLVTVRLRGKAANPTGVGARITVVSAANETQVTEVYAGQGYLSQSTAASTFAVDRSVDCTVHVVWPSGVKSDVLVTDQVEVEIGEP